MVPTTYLEFHALFLLPPLLLLSAAALRGRPRERLVYPLPVAAITVVALLYTTPWDNLLIIQGVWGYGPDTVVARIWAAPLEEYLFILVQPVVGALWLHRCGQWFDRPEAPVPVRRRARIVGTGVAVLVGVVGVAMLTVDATLYMGAILAWSAPVLALQWAVGWPYLWARRRLVGVAIGVPTLYLSTVDRIAIENGIWTLSDQFTTGLTVAGLPIEEGAFFFLTMTFVVQGLVLYPWVLDRYL